MLNYKELLDKQNEGYDLTPLETAVLRVYEAKEQAKNRKPVAWQHHLGFYYHFKGNMYEVIGFSEHSETKEVLVNYKKVGSERCWSRPFASFFDTAVCFNGEKFVDRFQLDRHLLTQKQAFVQLLRKHKSDWNDLVTENPAVFNKIVGDPYKYTVGDKIAFAVSLRLITRKQGEILLTWVNGWEQNTETR